MIFLDVITPPAKSSSQDSFSKIQFSKKDSKARVS